MQIVTVVSVMLNSGSNCARSAEDARSAMTRVLRFMDHGVVVVSATTVINEVTSSLLLFPARSVM